MIPRIVLFGSLLLLTSCATLLGPPAPTSIDRTEAAAPQAVDPRVCADIKPEPEVRGTIVQPVTAEEKEYTAQFLEGEAQVRDWGRELAELLGLAKKAVCKPVAAAPSPNH